MLEALRAWSFPKLIAVAGSWTLGCIVLGFVLPVAWAFLRLYWEMQRSEGGGGIGTVSAGISEAAILLALLPPIALIGAWFVAKFSAP